MSKEPEHSNHQTPADEPQFQTSSDSRGGWLLIGGFIVVLVLLVGVELMRA